MESSSSPQEALEDDFPMPTKALDVVSCKAMSPRIRKAIEAEESSNNNGWLGRQQGMPRMFDFFYFWNKMCHGSVPGCNCQVEILDVSSYSHFSKLFIFQMLPHNHRALNGEHESHDINI